MSYCAIELGLSSEESQLARRSLSAGEKILCGHCWSYHPCFLIFPGCQIMKDPTSRSVPVSDTCTRDQATLSRFVTHCMMVIIAFVHIHASFMSCCCGGRSRSPPSSRIPLFTSFILRYEDLSLLFKMRILKTSYKLTS
ncbi:uncharacterized protein LOC132608841 isoform X3 [Lycium barbarum]|uniref:uncharacterized protein LOC132608841 isoform X3 n=1 Tax=Lycium barbarum TaxID=112863 RepID=UPI00293F5472|nr:uncharacterized protein LOC132608841 isoform X3 [Lycium barbarum]